MKTVRSLSRIIAVAWSAVLAFVILGFGAGIWGALLVGNLKTTPAIPWAVPAMAFVLWLMWQYLDGKWWPRSTSDARRANLRANRVSGAAFACALLAGVLSIVALAGYWIVMFRLVKMPANALPDFSQYPLLTTALVLVMASLVSPVTEEAAFRGYCQSILERQLSGPATVAVSSVLFALAHVNYGFLWPKLLVYFLAGVAFGVTANLTQSILPGIVVHILADLTFFTLVWPHDAARRLIWQGGADAWFCTHAAQAVTFTALAVLAFRRLARITKTQRAR